MRGGFRSTTAITSFCVPFDRDDSAPHKCRRLHSKKLHYVSEVSDCCVHIFSWLSCFLILAAQRSGNCSAYKKLLSILISRWEQLRFISARLSEVVQFRFIFRPRICVIFRYEKIQRRFDRTEFVSINFIRAIYMLHSIPCKPSNHWWSLFLASRSAYSS